MNKILSNMTANVWKVNVNVGDSIEEGQEVVILESMKMEIPVVSENGGIVQEINIGEGEFVNEGDVIITLE